MSENSKLILNGDDELLSGLKGLLPMPVSSMVLMKTVIYMLMVLKLLGKKEKFNIEIRNQEVEIVLPVPGIHNVSDALAAVACGLELGITNENIQKGLMRYLTKE